MAFAFHFKTIQVEPVTSIFCISTRFVFETMTVVYQKHSEMFAFEPMTAQSMAFAFALKSHVCFCVSTRFVFETITVVYQKQSMTVC